METKTIKGIAVSIFQDKIFKISYVNFLSQDEYFKIKLPCEFSEYKYQHLLQPSFMLDCEIVKTKKNWILKHILRYEQICNPSSFSEFIKLSQICQIIDKQVKENQNSDVLDFLINFFGSSSLKQVSLQDFEFKLNQNLGFNA